MSRNIATGIISSMKIYKYLSLLISIVVISCGGHKNDSSNDSSSVHNKFLPTPEDSLIYAVLVIEDSLDHTSRFNKYDLKWMLEENYDSIKIEELSRHIKRAKFGESILYMDFEQASEVMKRINSFSGIFDDYRYVIFCGSKLLSNPSDSLVIHEQEDYYLSLLEKELEEPSQGGELSPKVAYGPNMGDTLALWRRELKDYQNPALSQKTLPWVLKYRDGYGFGTGNEFELDGEDFYIYFDGLKKKEWCNCYLMIDVNRDKLNLDSHSATIFVGGEELGPVYSSEDISDIRLYIHGPEDYTKINRFIDILDKGNVTIEIRDKDGLKKIWTLTDETRNARNMASFLKRIDYSKYEW